MNSSSRAFARDYRGSPGVGRSGHRSGLAAVFAFAALVGGCSQIAGDRAATGIYRLFNSNQNPAIATLESTVEYTVVPPSRAMVNAPEALVVFDRNLNGAIEQKIILPNATALPGDNEIHIRAQTSDSAQLERFRLSDIETRFGGLPAPFRDVSESSLNTGRDALGSYVYATQDAGPNTVCVLVMRRLGVGARPLPRGTRALDLVMRNCVNGSLQDALAPMGERVLAVGGNANGTNYTLSPHAAPSG